MTTTRKVIQIVTLPPIEEGYAGDGMMVLCDDGTMWVRQDNSKRWVELAGPPGTQPSRKESTT